MFFLARQAIFPHVIQAQEMKRLFKLDNSLLIYIYIYLQRLPEVCFSRPSTISHRKLKPNRRCSSANRRDFMSSSINSKRFPYSQCLRTLLWLTWRTLHSARGDTASVFRTRRTFSSKLSTTAFCISSSRRHTIAGMPRHTKRFCSLSLITKYSCPLLWRTSLKKRLKFIW